MTLEEEGCVTKVLDEYVLLTGWLVLTKIKGRKIYNNQVVVEVIRRRMMLCG